jgi:hypothetical protein
MFQLTDPGFSRSRIRWTSQIFSRMTFFSRCGTFKGRQHVHTYVAHVFHFQKVYVWNKQLSLKEALMSIVKMCNFVYISDHLHTCFTSLIRFIKSAHRTSATRTFWTRCSTSSARDRFDKTPFRPKTFWISFLIQILDKFPLKRYI